MCVAAGGCLRADSNVVRCAAMARTTTAHERGLITSAGLLWSHRKAADRTRAKLAAVRGGAAPGTSVEIRWHIRSAAW
jgi:hypothetical protein